MSTYDRVFGSWLGVVRNPTRFSYPRSKCGESNFSILVNSRFDEISERPHNEFFLPFGPGYGIQSLPFYGPLSENPQENEPVFSNLETKLLEYVSAEITVDT